MKSFFGLPLALLIPKRPMAMAMVSWLIKRSKSARGHLFALQILHLNLALLPWLRLRQPIPPHPGLWGRRLANGTAYFLQTLPPPLLSHRIMAPQPHQLNLQGSLLRKRRVYSTIDPRSAMPLNHILPRLHLATTPILERLCFYVILLLLYYHCSIVLVWNCFAFSFGSQCYSVSLSVARS